jgi:hypothetical protein
LPFVPKDTACAVRIDEKDGCEVELCFAAWIDQNTTSCARARAASTADLSNIDSGAPDRLAQTEPENADARDLLGRSQAKE